MGIYRKNHKEQIYDEPMIMIKHAMPKKLTISKYPKRNDFRIGQGADEVEQMGEAM
jgi:hypothetical protein